VIVEDFKVPELSLSLARSASQIVYVGGEVQQPKVVTINGPIRILNAVMMAGGTKDSARLDSVILIRYTDFNTPNVHLLDVNQVLRGELSDVWLKPYDIVYVPKTSIASADVFMQHIWKILPVNFTFTFPYVLNRESEVTVIRD
jgi:protein involved in polysaccharide export with SLBB domain